MNKLIRAISRSENPVKQCNRSQRKGKRQQPLYRLRMNDAMLPKFAAFWRKHGQQTNSLGLSSLPHCAGAISNGDFVLKTHQTFSVHTKPWELKKRSNRRPFWICRWGKLGQRNHVISMIIVTSSFSKSSGFKMFSSTQKRKTDVSKFLRFKEFLRQKSAFSLRISVDGRPNRRNKAAFPNCSGLKSVSEKLLFLTD